MPRRTAMLTAALAASALAASPALADPHAIDSHNRSDSPAATSTRTWSPGDDLAAYPTPAKAAAIQPGQPTWPVNPKVLTPPPDGSVRGGSTDNDDIWVVLGLGLAGVALAGGAAGAARYARVRARRVAV
jgi:hypothetical protein